MKSFRLSYAYIFILFNIFILLLSKQLNLTSMTNKLVAQRKCEIILYPSEKNDICKAGQVNEIF